MIDVLLWAVVVPIMFVSFLVTVGSAFANHLMVGWALALGVVAYGNPVGRFGRSSRGWPASGYEGGD